MRRLVLVMAAHVSAARNPSRVKFIEFLQVNAAPPLFFDFGPGVSPHPAFPFPSKRGDGAPRGARELGAAPFTGLRGRCFAPRFRDPSS